MQNNSGNTEAIVQNNITVTLISDHNGILDIYSLDCK